MKPGVRIVTLPYSNGQNLRNRYVHGSNSQGQLQQESEYVWLLKNHDTYSTEDQ